MFQAYKEHLKSEGVNLIDAKGGELKGDIKAGKWFTGSDGTYIYAYIEESWPRDIQMKVIEAAKKALAYPALIGEYMKKNGAIV